MIASSFETVSDLKATHLELMRQAVQSVPLTLGETSEKSPQQPPSEVIRAFRSEAIASGRWVANPTDRRAVQRIIDYWTTELSGRLDATAEDQRPTLLARAEVGGAADAAFGEATLETLEPTANGTGGTDHASTGAKPSVFDGQASGPAGATVLAEDEMAEQLRIRVAAMARQWRGSHLEGYLLGGLALDQARTLLPGPDIDDFLKTSIEAQNRTLADEKARLTRVGRIKTVAIIGFAALCLGLGASTWMTLLSARDVEKLNGQLSAQIEIAGMAAAVAIDESGKARAAAGQLTSALDIANQKAADATRQVAALDEARDLLARSVGLIAAALQRGQIDTTEVDPKLLDMVLVHIAEDVKAERLDPAYLTEELRTALYALIGSTDSIQFGMLGGYDPSFVRTQIAVPQPQAPDLAAQKLWPYANFSVKLDPTERLAIFAAVNLDRTRVLALQTVPVPLRPDSRVAVASQADPRWFDDSSVAAVSLADAGDVAWGDVVEGDPGKAALRVASYAGALPNLVPQPQALKAGPWAALNEWVRNSHNPLADRVTIFAGPVFGTPGLGDRPPQPEGYWKVAISAVPDADKPGTMPGDPLYAVDAFLIPRDAGDASGNLDGFRIRIEELEERTGLRFDTLIEWTDAVVFSGPNEMTPADGLANRVAALRGAEDTDVRNLAADLSQVLPRRDLPTAELAKVVEALVDMAGAARFASFSPQAQSAVVASLALVPQPLWDRTDWVALRSEARIQLVSGAFAAGAPALPEAVTAAANRLRAVLKLQPEPQTVYLQFAGMTRETAVALSAQMKALGWNIPGEERLASAATFNEIRYNPNTRADFVAAYRLAADLAAAGTRADPVPVAIVRPGVLEIWISH